MAAFDNLRRAAFNGIEFPLVRCRVRGGIRHHVHEYPHIAGGDVEKLGRKLYEIEMQSTFQSVGSGAESFGGWGPIWPKRLSLLRTVFEAQTTAPLVIPTIGELRSCCTDWDQEMVERMRSGETTTFKFLEDQEAAFAFANQFSFNTATLPALAEKVSVEFDKAEIGRPFTDELLDTVNFALAALDQVELSQMLIASKIGMVAALCNEFDQRITQFQDPANWPAVEAMKELWAAAQNLAGNVDNDTVRFAVYAVPSLMSISEVATAIYGDSERAIELLQLNPIEDAYQVRPSTRIRYVLPVDASEAA